MGEHEQDDNEEQDEMNFTIRSTIVGLAIGSLMCFSNMYFGLQTGWISMMSLQASLLGYAVFKPFQNKLKQPFGTKENVYLQTVAVATATMPLAAGFVGIIPALTQLTSSDYPSGPIILPAWKLVLWSIGLSFIGVFFAVPLRKETIIKEKLKFPSGTATAQMINVLHDRPNTTTATGLLDGSCRPRHRRTPYMARNVPLQPQDDTLDEYHYVEAHELSPVSEFEDGEELSSNQEQQSDITMKKKTEHDKSWTIKLNVLMVSFFISSAYTLLSYFFPIIYALPIFNWMTLNYVDLKAWEWYFTPSLSYIGQGIIMGLPTTLSMLLGCITGWAILSPIAHFAGWAPGPINDWKTGSKGWILWISLGIMISESLVSLGIVFLKQLVNRISMYRASKNNDNRNEEQHEDLLVRTSSDGWEDGDEDTNNNSRLLLKDSLKDAPNSQQVSLHVTLIGSALSVALCVAMISLVFGNQVMPVGMTLLSILFALFLSILGVRALGETDLNPVSGIGKVSQVLFAGIMPGAIVANLIAGGIAEAGAQQAGDLMQDLKTGHLLGASPKAQFYGQLVGSLVSSFVATGAYLVYTSVYTIPGPEFPAPTAQVWLDMSRLVNGQPLPPHVFEFVLAFSFLFGILTLVKETSNNSMVFGWRKYIPQGIAFAIGIYNPPSFTLARVIGGFLVYAWENYCDSSHEEDDSSDKWSKPYKEIGKVLIIIVASGFVLGEGTFAIVNMILHACRIPHF